MTNQSVFEHRGVTIALLPDGRFAARIAGKSRTSGSIAALKKLIDKAAEEAPFEPFDALHIYSVESGFDEVRVTGISRGRFIGVTTKSKASWRDGRSWSYEVATPDTPENRALMEDYITKKRHAQAETKRLGEEALKAFQAIPKIDAKNRKINSA